MNIAICEDNRKDLEQIHTLCRRILETQNAAAHILDFQNGEELLNAPQDIDLLLLDIEMPGINGIQIKERFQYQSQKTMILFVTAHDEYMPSAFGMQVFAFIHKKQLEAHLNEILPKALQILQSFVLIDGKIDSRQVVYIASEHVYSRLFLSDGSEHLLRTPLGNLEELLRSVHFIRIHKSFLVNAMWIKKWREKEVLTDCGSLPCSVRMKANAKKQYDDYCLTHARY